MHQVKLKKVKKNQNLDEEFNSQVENFWKIFLIPFLGFLSLFNTPKSFELTFIDIIGFLFLQLLYQIAVFSPFIIIINAVFLVE